MGQKHKNNRSSNLLEQHLQVQQRVTDIHSKMLEEMQNSLAVQEALMSGTEGLANSTDDLSFKQNSRVHSEVDMKGMDPSHPLVKFAHLLKGSMPHGTVCEAFPHGRGIHPDAILIVKIVSTLEKVD